MGWMSMWWKVVLEKMSLTKVGPCYISTIPSRTTPLFSFLFLRLPYPCDVERCSAEVLSCPSSPQFAILKRCIVFTRAVARISTRGS